MIIDPTVIPGLVILAAELVALATVGYVVVRVALRQADHRMALAQGLVVGPALWGIITNFVMYAVPGLAGAIVGWAIVLALGGVLACRAPRSLPAAPALNGITPPPYASCVHHWPQPRVVARFAVAFLVLFWIALASRQLLGVPTPQIQLGHAAAIRAGAFLPGLPWSPGVTAPYHFGAALHTGLLMPPVGPDLAFVWELLGAFTWTSFALIVLTLLLTRAPRYVVLVTGSLLLTAGAWTVTSAVGDVLIKIPIPAGLPAAGLRASLTEIYWPVVNYQVLPDMRHAALPDIWNHSFPMAYALVVVVLERAARTEQRSWPAAVTLAGLTGFTGLLAYTVGPVLLLAWAFLELVALVQLRLASSKWPIAALRPAVVGLALGALVLLLAGVNGVAGLFDQSTPSSLSLAWNPVEGNLDRLERFEVLPGGVGLLGAGPLIVAVAAVLLGWRDRFVLALALGAGILILAWLVLNYAPASANQNRLAGHARNFALIALLLALTDCLAGLKPRWRYATGVLLVGLVVWPTVVEPVRYLGLAIRHGVEIANAPQSNEPHPRYGGRFSLDAGPSERVADYIWNYTAVDSRILSPTPNQLTYATGRPNAAGFVGLVHYISYHGPDYLDALQWLEPAAMRRMGANYVHAPDAWVEGLPPLAVQRLNDPRLFELLVRDEGEAIYRVRPEFLRLDSAPAPASFEALRQAVSASATVYIPPQFQSLGSLRAAYALSHARLLGPISQAPLFQQTPWRTEPFSAATPDLVILPASIEPWTFLTEGRRPIWWNGDIAIYAPKGAVDPVMPPPPDSPLPPEPPPVGVRVSDLHAMDGQINFTLTIDDRAPDRWTGQDWVLVAGEASPMAIPTRVQPDGRTPVVEQWFAGRIPAGRGTTIHHFAFVPGSARLAVREGGEEFPVATSGEGVGEGVWMLALRLMQREDRGTYVAQEEVALIPVLQIALSESGEVTAFVYDDIREADLHR